MASLSHCGDEAFAKLMLGPPFHRLRAGENHYNSILRDSQPIREFYGNTAGTFNKRARIELDSAKRLHRRSNDGITFSWFLMKQKGIHARTDGPQRHELMNIGLTSPRLLRSLRRDQCRVKTRAKFFYSSAGQGIGTHVIRSSRSAWTSEKTGFVTVLELKAPLTQLARRSTN